MMCLDTNASLPKIYSYDEKDMDPDVRNQIWLSFKEENDMPYIKNEDKKRLHNIEFEIENSNIENSGELNYLFTLIAKRYVAYKGLRYQYINDVVGALDGAKIEFQRRVVGPYEDEKIKENGDVY